jgi:hypothetical protein
MEFPAKIETANQAKAYINKLIESGLMYHFEDSAEDVIFLVPVSNEDLKIMDELSDQLFKIDGFCPFDYALNRMA